MFNGRNVFFLIDKLSVCEGNVSLLKDRSKRHVALIKHKDENGEYVPNENSPKLGDKITIEEATVLEFNYTKTGEVEADST